MTIRSTKRARTISKSVPWTVAILALGICACDLAGPTRATAQSDTDTRVESSGKFEYSLYAEVLAEFLDGNGRVDYRALKGDRAGLDQFIRLMRALDPAVVESWSDEAKMALWINAYNALTLQVIIDHYPIKSSFAKSLIYPKNSIRQIDGVWDELTHVVAGRQVTLGGIEHEILRKEFNQPLVHMGLVCASISCPTLRAEPYVGERLLDQLGEQTVQFFSDGDKYRLDRRRERAYLSPIFDWFEEDFVRYQEEVEGKSGVSGKQAVFDFVNHHVETTDRVPGDYRISYLDYDWSLNEQ